MDWVDSLKGFAILLVVYGHNFPFCEKYIYSFHMPLFIIISGFFYPKVSSFGNLKSRFKTLVIPYFIWALLLYVFWFLIAKKMGESANLGLSDSKNFVGVFFAQGGREYMDWGIPLWFLPMLFLAFGFRYLIDLISGKTSLQFVIAVIFASIGLVVQSSWPWSFNVALVATLFLFMGKIIFEKINQIDGVKLYVLMALFFVLHCLLYNQNAKIDMYRSQYGNGVLFLLNGFTGAGFLILFFKKFVNSKALAFVGKFSMVILALQILSLSFIKLVIMILFKSNDFDFSEFQKFSFSLLQVILLVPVFLLINKYFPILNGGFKKV